MAKAAVLNLFNDIEKGDLVSWLEAHAGDDGWPAETHDAAVWLNMVKPGEVQVPRSYLEAITSAYYDWLDVLANDPEDEEKEFMTKLLEYEDEDESEDDDSDEDDAEAPWAHLEDDDEEVEILMEDDEVEQELKSEQASFVASKETLCRLLEGMKIVRVDFDYSGCNKNTSLDGFTLKNAEDKEETWQKFKETVVELNGKPELLHDALEAFCWDVVEAQHTSWNYEDGGFGSIVIDVAERKVKLEHNEYVMTTTNYEHEL